MTKTAEDRITDAIKLAEAMEDYIIAKVLYDRRQILATTPRRSVR